MTLEPLESHSDRRFQWSLSCGPTADELRLARSLADRLSATAERREEARAVIGELASNAVRHAHTPYTVTVTADLEAITIEVKDQSMVLPELRPLAPSQAGGRGLHIIDGLADEWGTMLHGDSGKTVWARLDRALPALRRVR